MVTSGDLRIRLSENQKRNLKTLAEAEGYKTISDFVRCRCFDQLSIHIKLNEILNLLSKEQEGLRCVKPTKK